MVQNIALQSKALVPHLEQNRQRSDSFFHTLIVVLEEVVLTIVLQCDRIEGILTEIIVDLLVSDLLCKLSCWLFLILDILIVLLLVDLFEELLSDAGYLHRLWVFLRQKESHKLLDLPHLLGLFFLFLIGLE